MCHNVGHMQRPRGFWLTKKLSKILLVVIAVSGIFALGWLTGNGKLSIRSRPNLGSVSSGLPGNLDYSSVEQLYDLLRERFDGELDANALQDGVKRGLVEATGDPYTEYLTPKEAKEFREDLNGSFTGIGAQLGKNDKGNVVIISPIDGFPAKKADLRPNDIIAEVDGQDASRWSVEQARDKIRGPKGSTVKLRIIRGSQDLNFEITREEITIPSVESKMLSGNTGYIKITQFGDDTVRLAQDAARQLKSQNATSMILDLRGNPGGNLDGAVDVSSMWLKNDSVILEEKRDNKVIKTYKARGDAVLNGMPTVVLIDEGSASASEIVAAALRDNKAATLLGAKSFGKGSVQLIENLQNGGALKVTIAKWYTPNGQNIHKEGITPDKKIERTEDDFKNNRDPQLDEAIKHLNTR